MAHRVLHHVAEVQVGQSFVPTIVVQPVQVGPGNEGLVGFHRHLHLERVGFILLVIIGRIPTVDDEYGNRLTRASTLQGRHVGGPDQANHLQTAAVRDREINWLG